MSDRPSLFREPSNFGARKRQKLLFETYYINFLSWLDNLATPKIIESFTVNAENDAGLAQCHSGYGDTLFDLFKLKYTAGEPIESLKPLLQESVSQYEAQAEIERKIENEPEWPAFSLTSLDQYVRFVGLLSVAILLREQNLIPRIYSLIAGSGFDRQDALIEELLSHYLPERPYLDEWYHDEPYRWLLDSTAGDTQEEKLADLKKYLVKWYGGMKGTGWYDAHKGMTDEGMGGYDGYWAWEAGAIAFLHGIDDSTIDSMYYPKDLVAYARSFGPPPSEAEGIEAAQQRLRCEAGNACPKSGYWVSPAYQQGDKYFKQGEVMPHIEGNQWGATIWQFVRE
ncbi:MAG: DUF1911 domain-containing protein [Rhodocyclaceae bacterium]|nr:MAG: DUF1911 domain-containing protein [Rhodocyclaceae bacterium]